MSKLKDGIPRGYGDHRRKAARMYAEALRAMVERFPKLPACARPLLREYGKIVLLLDRLSAEHDAAMERRRLSDARRLRRELKTNRFLLLKLQLQIERLAGTLPGTDLAQALMEMELES